MPQDRGTSNLDEALGLERVEPAASDPERDKWVRWLDQIDKDLSNLFINRMAWRGLTSVWRDRVPPLPPSFIFDVWAQTYAHTQASGVRRQAHDRRNDVASLRRLLSDIAAHPERISRDFFVGRYEWGTQHLGASEFGALDPKSSGHLDPAIAAADIDELVEAADEVIQWTHKAIAHLSEVPAQTVPTFNDLDKALDVVGRIFQRWNCILTGQDLAYLEPVPQYDWLAPLRVPWITPSDEVGPEPTVWRH